MSATKEYWSYTLQKLKKLVPGSSFKTWFSSVDFVSTSNRGRKITISVPSVIAREYIEKKFKSQLNEAIAKYYPQVVHVDFQVKKEVKLEQSEKTLVQEEIISVPKVTPSELSEAEKLESISSYLPKRNINNLNPKYTLENFVVNGSNDLAVSVAKSVVREPGHSYNPVFIYSRTGMGKTHLLQAVGQKVLEEKPGYKIKYSTLETFFNHFIVSVEKNKGREFREYYRSVDLLLLDDIQFIRGKVGTQEAFFHTFNELHQQNKQIVIASDRPPKSLDGVEDRLVSRFEWGMVVDIAQPSLEDRIAIFNYKLQLLGLNLSQEYILEICKRVDTNIRDLEGVLNRIQARIKLLPDKEINDTDMGRILSGYQKNNTMTIHIGQIPANSAKIIEVVSKVFSLSKEDVMGKCREKNIALARQLAMWYCKKDLDLSYPTIGKLFNGKDHSTVMHACQKVDKLKNEELVKRRIELIDQLLRS
ncbi:MAG: chromosomal replication initiator protein DnaA [Patescibacteria group bacterium]